MSFVMFIKFIFNKLIFEYSINISLFQIKKYFILQKILISLMVNEKMLRSDIIHKI